MSRGAALATLWLACICPFTASYTAAPLTETPTLLMLALAMWAMVRFRDQPRWPNALWFTFAVTCAALLRPDGALAAVAFAPALVIGLERNPSNSAHSDCAQGGFFLMKKPLEERTSGYTCSDSAVPPGAMAQRKLMRMAVVCVLLALTPFAVWTARNWRVFHVFEPLAPRLATDPDERPNRGWERWVKSWCLDFVSTYDIYWNVPGDKLDVSKLPSRAFDSAAQYAETAALAADYNSHGMEITPDIDARFDKLAEERIAAHPLRYYVGLPLGRVADMWLRPRVENLQYRPGLVGLFETSRRHGIQLGVRRAERAVSAAGNCGAVPSAALMGRIARVYAAAQRIAAHRCGAGDALHAGVLPHAVCAGGVALWRMASRLYLPKLKAPLGNG